MKRRKFGLAALLFLAAASLMGQTVERTESGVRFSTSQPVLNGEIVFYSPSIVRVVKYPSAERPEKKSYPVVMTPQQVDISFEQKGEEVVLRTANVVVVLDAGNGQVEFHDLKGETLLAEKPFGTNFLPRRDVNKSSYKVSQAFMLQPDEVIYGLGQRQAGVMNHRNQQIE